jgi:hypothetical protein
MKGTAIGVAMLLAAIAQVTVAPLFPVAGSVPELVLLGLVLLAAFISPTPVMVVTPLVAVALAFLSDRSPGILLLAYLPLLPLGFALEESSVPLNHYVRTLAMMVVTGVWLRTLLAVGAMAGGATPAFSLLVSDVLVPGLLLDAVLLTVVYIPIRLAGRSGRGMTLQRSRYY